jgi:hypothetical protein
MQRQVRHPSHAILPAVLCAAPGLLASGTAIDALTAGTHGVLTWLAFWTIVAGIAFGTWCAAWALLDWILLADVGNTGVCGLDGFLTAIVVTLYVLAVSLRLDSPAHSATEPAMALEVGAGALLGMKTWLGRELGAWLAR